MKHPSFIYIIIPLGVWALLTGFYYSTVPVLESVVAPEIGREFGLLESLQLICLLAGVILSIRALWKPLAAYKKVIATLSSVLFLFVFLEEIDYGINYYEALFDVSSEDRVPVAERNWHNRNDFGEDQNGDYLRRGLDVVMAVYFIVLPLGLSRMKRPVVKYFVPSLWFAAAGTLVVLMNQTSLFIDNLPVNSGRPLTSNVNEFNELNVYYLAVLYLYTLLFRKSI